MDRAKWIKACLLIPVLVFFFLYLSGYIAQFISNYTTWRSENHFAGDGTSPQIPTFSVLVCLKAIFNFPSGIYGIGICITAIGVLFLFIMKLGAGEGEEYDRERNLIYSSKGTYGTAGYMSKKEMEQVLKVEDIRNADGIVLGRIEKKAVCLPAKTRMNRNIAVFGASGSMKSRAFARNMLFQCIKRGESIIVTDPKSELANDTAIYLKKNGYQVKIFNLVNPENSDAWNCLKEIQGQELMAQLLTDVIIKNTASEKSDHFWDSAEGNLLKAVSLYVEQEYPEESKNMGEAYKLLTLNNEAALNKLFDLLPVTHPAKAPYSIFKQSGENVRSNIIVGLGSRLQVFQNELIRQITGHDEINLELPGQKKCAYFCITSDQDTTLDFLSSLFFSFLFIKLVRFADKHGKEGKLEIPVTFILDEFPNIGKIPDFTKKISTIRSRDISVSVIFQNIAQLENRYPLNQWQEILGNCDTQLFLGCTDEVTAEFISDRTGEVTVGIQSTSKELNSWRVSNYTPQYRETSSTGKRKLLTPDEVLRIPLDEALIILRGQKVLRVNKFDYSLHPESKKLEPCNVAEHIPEWRKNNQNKTTKKQEVINTRSAPESEKNGKGRYEPFQPKENKKTFNRNQQGNKNQQETEKAAQESQKKQIEQETANVTNQKQDHIINECAEKEHQQSESIGKETILEKQQKQVTIADKNSIMS